MKTQDFPDLLSALRNGDQRAAEDLVRRYEPQILKVIRMRLKNQRLRRLFDSMDIFQSIMTQFFKHVPTAEWPLKTEDELMRLLVTMVRNNLRNKNTRAGRIIPESLPGDWEAPAAGPSPERAAAGRELVQVIRSGLPDAERLLFDLRALSLTWPEIAERPEVVEQFGPRQPNVLRMRLDRAVTRLGLELLEETCDDPR